MQRGCAVGSYYETVLYVETAARTSHTADPPLFQLHTRRLRVAFTPAWMEKMMHSLFGL